MEMTLRLPSTYVDIERDELEYVDGGFYVTYNQIEAMTFVIGGMGAATVYYACVAASATFRSFLCTIPVIGWVIAGIGAYALRGIPGAFADAIMQRKGVEIGLKKTWFKVPYDLDLTVR